MRGQRPAACSAILDSRVDLIPAPIQLASFQWNKRRQLFYRYVEQAISLGTVSSLDSSAKVEAVLGNGLEECRVECLKIGGNEPLKRCLKYVGYLFVFG